MKRDTPPFAIAFTANRDWRDTRAIAVKVRKLPPGSIVIHGDAVGGDRIVKRYAEARGDLYVASVPAARNLSPLERNDKMLDMLEGLRSVGYDVMVYGFTKDIEIIRSGTNSTLRKAQKRGLPYAWSTKKAA